MKLTIFYSWQSELPQKSNRHFIKKCLVDAVEQVSKLNDFVSVTFEIIEGIAGETGSVPVASTINEKRIPSCDIFVADLTTVTHRFPSSFTDEQKAELRTTIRPAPNANVLIEHGVAQKSIGVERIIGVMNNYYGSPRDEPDRIPFDIRHLRYPIEFTAGETDNDISSQRKALTRDFKSAIESCARYAREHYKSKYSPFRRWSEWEKNIMADQPFRANEKVNEILSLVEQTISEGKLSLRLIGLSGLGKTRILFEHFRPGRLADTTLSENLLYVNCHVTSPTELFSVIDNIVQDGEPHILVIDNCSPDIHERH
jgi:hypothetical protein